LSRDYILSASNDGTVRVWSLATLDCLHILKHKGKVLGVATDNEKIVSVSDEGCKIFDMRGNLRSIIPKSFLCVALYGSLIYCGGHAGVWILDFDVDPKLSGSCLLGEKDIEEHKNGMEIDEPDEEE